MALVYGQLYCVPLSLSDSGISNLEYTKIAGHEIGAVVGVANS